MRGAEITGGSAGGAFVNAPMWWHLWEREGKEQCHVDHSDAPRRHSLVGVARVDARGPRILRGAGHRRHAPWPGCGQLIAAIHRGPAWAEGEVNDCTSGSAARPTRVNLPAIALMQTDGAKVMPR